MSNTLADRFFGQSQPRHRLRAPIDLPPSSILSDRLLWLADEAEESYLLTALKERDSKREGRRDENDFGHPIYALALRGLSKDAHIQEVL